jgi:tetratricopeptide (TPR) repeat protein
MKQIRLMLVGLLACASLSMAQQAGQPGVQAAEQPDFQFIRFEAGSNGYRAFEREVFADFVSAAQGDAEALERLVAICERAIAADAAHAEAIAWRGAAKLFEAGEASSNGDFRAAMAFTSASLADLARARELEPDNPGVRMVAAQTLLNLAENHPIPNMARGYAKQGIEDARAALVLLEDKWSQQPDDIKGRLLVGVAQAYDKLGEATKARDWFNRAIGAVPGTTWAEQAQAWIDAADKKASSF